jgi:peroxiredoxin
MLNMTAHAVLRKLTNIEKFPLLFLIDPWGRLAEALRHCEFFAHVEKVAVRPYSVQNLF